MSAAARQGNTVLPVLTLPNRSLSYAKTMQDESNGKTGKHRFTWIDTAEPQFVLCKDNAR